MAPKKSLRRRVAFVLPVALGVFLVGELVSWVRRKPAVSSIAPLEPGAPLVDVELVSAPPPARPQVWGGTAAPVELRTGDRVAFWPRVEPMTPALLAELGAVTLSVRLRGAVSSPSAVCAMHKPGGTAWTELCGADKGAVCLRTAPECVLVAPAPGSYVVEANVEWLEGKAPKAAAVTPFVHRAL